MTCYACASFADNPLSGQYKSGCIDCSTRSIARSQAYTERDEDAPIDGKYRAALERAFTGDWRTGHAAVKAWVEKVNGVAV